MQPNVYGGGCVALRTGLWDGEGDFNFLETYGLSRMHLSPYATRRVWRVLSTAAPSLAPEFRSPAASWIAFAPVASNRYTLPVSSSLSGAPTIMAVSESATEAPKP